MSKLAISNNNTFIEREGIELNVIVCGAAGKMGAEVVKAIYEDSELELVGAVDTQKAGQDAGVFAGIGEIGLKIVSTIKEAQTADVLVDFTHPSCVGQNILDALDASMHVVVGTTGLSDEQLKAIEDKCSAVQKNVFIAPNFAIGAILMMELSKKAAKYMDNAEIIELHHNQKADAPSGTALKTADELNAVSVNIEGEKENVKGSRGGIRNNIRIHSIRLPGLIANQEVLFGAKGQTLSIRHDTTDRSSFMPGVVLAVKKVAEHEGLTYGLEKLLEI